VSVLVVGVALTVGCDSAIERVGPGPVPEDAAAAGDDAAPVDDAAAPPAGDGGAPRDAGPGAEGGAPDAQTPDGYVPDPVAVNEALGRGVNLGNFLEAPNEGEWAPGGRLIQEGDFLLIKQAGFDSVRLPVKWSAHAGAGAPYTIDAAFLARVQQVVDWALAQTLLVVLNIHHYDEIHADPTGHAPRFVALWQQIATAFKDRPLDRLVLELLNEPTNQMTAADWNTLLRQGIQAIRPIDPQRTLMIGPWSWNAAWTLPQLDVPAEEENVIVTVHMYDPFWFTHSGAAWVSPTPAAGAVWTGSASDKEPIGASLDTAATWAATHGRPIYVGEFGAYSAADSASRVRWTTYVVDAMAARGFSWGYWEFCAGFGAYDPDAQAWRPELLQALIH
jgi:endoglucanase